MEDAQFGTDLEGLTRKAHLQKNLEKITTDVKPYWTKLDKLISIDKHQGDIAKAVLSPRKNHLEKKAVQIWFASSKWAKLEAEYTKIYSDAVKKGRIDDGKFTKFALFSRFTLMMR